MANESDIADRLMGPEEAEQVETATVAEEAPQAAPEGDTPPETVETPVETPEAVLEPAKAQEVAKPASEAGLIRDLQEERAKRQEERDGRQAAEAESKVLRDQIAMLADEDRTSVDQPAAVPDLSTLPDDDLVTVGQARQVLPAMARKIALEVVEERELAVSERAAKAELTAEKCGVGLDYDSVVAAGAGNLLPGDKQYIRSQGLQSAQTAYDLCLTRTPGLRTKVEAARIQTAVDAAVAAKLKELGIDPSKTPNKPSIPAGGTPGAARPSVKAAVKDQTWVDRLMAKAD